MSEAAIDREPAATPLRGLALARMIALLLPLSLLAGALGSQYLGGLHPCEMCYWQRWPHGAAILLAGLAFTATAAELEKKGIKDFQLDYALNTLKRIAGPVRPAASIAKKGQ